MTDTYNADEFLKRLTGGALRTPLICEGFAKPADGSYDAFLFSLGTSCKNWTKIPCDVIEEVEFLSERSCRDHSHPLVRIHFKEQSANEPFAAVSSLLRASDPEPMNQRVMMLPLTDEKIPPFIGEWMARVFADALWYGSPRGGGGHSPADILERKLCLELKRRCRNGDEKACRLLAEEC